MGYSNVKFSVTINHYNKIENKIIIKSTYLVLKKGNHSLSMYQKKNSKNQMNILLITEGEKRHNVLIKDFNRFMYNQTKHKERNILYALFTLFKSDTF